jgi:aromatic ring-opening dioxygenase LigB subunit
MNLWKFLQNDSKAKIVNLQKLFNIIASIPLENHEKSRSEIKITIIEKKKLVEDIPKERTKPSRIVVANKTVKQTRTSYTTIMYSTLLPLTRWNKQFHDIVHQLLTLKACLDKLRLDQFPSDWQGN